MNFTLLQQKNLLLVVVKVLICSFFHVMSARLQTAQTLSQCDTLEWFRSYLVGRRQHVRTSFYHVRCAAGVGTRPYSLSAVHCRSAVTD